jgi:Cytochrome c biogenesis factor
VELALFDLKRGDPDTAERELRECAKRFPAYPRAALQLGLFLLDRRREKEAVAPLKEAAARMRDDASAAEKTALACFRSGDVAGAKRYAQDALSIDRTFPDTYLLLAQIYDAHGTAEEAIGYVDQYLTYSPNPAPGYFLKGRLYARQASGNKAETWLRMAVDAEPSNAEYLTALGRVYYELLGSTRAQEGIRCYEKALEVDPQNSSAHRYLGHALLEQKQYPEAITHLRAALPGADDSGPILYDLGQALVKSGQTVEGERTLELFRQRQSQSQSQSQIRRPTR